MQHHSGSLQRDGLSIYYVENHPREQTTCPSVVLLHGGGEHLGRHENLARFLAARGCHVLRHDMRGAGRSGGLRGHVNRFNDYITDLEALLKEVQLGPPYVLVGQSVGGLLAAAFTLSHPEQVQGLILTSPFFRNKIAVPPWKEAAARILATLAPRLRLDNELPLDKLAHDPTVERSYREDDLCYGKVSTRWYAQIRRTQKFVLNNAGKITTPSLIVQGGADCIAEPEATKAFVASLGTDEKKLLFYQDAYHEVLNERYGPQVREEIINFIMQVASAEENCS